METTSKFLYFTIILLQCHVHPLDSHNVPCAFNTMCLCWIQDEDEFTRMDISCLGVPFSRFPDVSVSYVAQLDIVNSGMLALENDALVSSSGVEALGLMSNRLVSIGEKSLVGVSGSLRSLDLSYNSLEEMPFKALRGLKKLNWLNMHSNHMTSLDVDWGHVSETLTNGFFGDNSIAELPRVLSHFNNLMWLNLDDNNIKQVPEESLARNIRTISLNNNLITNFPQSVANLNSLGRIYLRGNSIKILELPSAFKSASVESIDLSDNMIESIRVLTTAVISNNVYKNSTKVVIKDLNLSNNKLSVIASGVFRFVETRRLHLSANNISYIDDGAFNGLENTLEYLNLDNNDLHNIPSALSTLKRITYLYLANNNIYNITADAFESYNEYLRVLSLATNNLATVPVTALSPCQRLQHLNLGYNKISYVFPGDFEWAKNLEILLLRNNVLSKLKSGTFKGAYKLRELSLSFNQLTELDDKAFLGIEESLEILEMSFAFSTDIYPKIALAPLTNLQWLVLDNNNFHVLESEALYSFNQLRYINLESNRLHYLPDKLFLPEVHGELRDIKIGYNYLEELPAGPFTNLTELRTIDLTGNRLHFLSTGTVEDCMKLVTVSLAYNRIATMDKGAFRRLSSLRFLNLEFNALTALDLDAIVESGGTEFSLNVSFNSISTINTQFRLNNLTSIDLGYNNITVLPSDTFSRIPNLKTLYLRGNYLATLYPGTFALEHLETLNLQDNRLVTLRKQTFHGTPFLQQLDLSRNSLSQLSTEQFRNLRNLRILNLSGNHIRSLSRDVFEGTRIETLDLSSNRISIVPSAAFLEVGYTLRDLNLAENLIEHLDSSAFPLSQLIKLNLANNRLTILPDNTFVSVNKLLSLNLSNNHIQANFKELFHYLPDLRQLYLANCGLRRVPVLPLGNLNILDLSFNAIQALDQANVQYLGSLKVLKLVNNSLNAVPDVRLRLLRHLDLSDNPIEALEKETFYGYPRLESLVLRKLSRIRFIDNECLRYLKYLKELSIQTWPLVDNYNLQGLLSGLPLRTVEIEVTERILKTQIHNTFTKRLRELTITGQELEAISPEAFLTIQASELILRIKDTHVRRFQSDIFLSLARTMSQLTLDLRNNHINELSPSVIYGNLSWETVGTNLVAGGLQVSGNPLECDCEIAWLSLWLRRWLREARQIHTASQSDARQLRSQAGRAVCTETTPSYSSDRVLLTLGTPHTACQASALSSGHLSRPPLPSQLGSRVVILLFIIRFGIDCT
ncbi:chaoptin-like [Microplitis mediator]|uniref:chaoptin-like n=1 Tax=Microplitis mediator TaxID=375433 RepID=UPI002554CD99|nr:chaoptin-like [Microplitis mediator]